MNEIVKCQSGFYFGDFDYINNQNVKSILEKVDYEDGKWGNDSGEIIITSTYSDGIYEDNHGNTYFVDSGSLSIIPLEMLSEEEISKAIEDKFGLVITDYSGDIHLKSEDNIITVKYGEELILIELG